MSFNLSENTKKLFNGYSVNEDFLNGSISSYPLYNANLILSGYNNTKIILDSLINKIDTNEKEIAFCFNFLCRLEEMSEFLEENQQNIKKLVINNNLKSFSLDDSKNYHNEFSYIDFDYNELHNGTSLKELNEIKQTTVNNIEDLLEKTKEVECLLMNLKDIFDEEYLEDKSEIMDCFEKLYDKLDVDVLNEVSEN